MSDRNRTRRSFLKRTAATGIGGLALVTASSGTTDAASIGETWDLGANTERITRGPPHGSQEWVDLKNHSVVRYVDNDDVTIGSEYSVDLITLHEAKYGRDSGNPAERTRGCLSRAGVAVAGRGSTEAIPSGSGQSYAGRLPPEATVKDDLDLTDDQLNDRVEVADSINETFSEVTKDRAVAVASVAAEALTLAGFTVTGGAASVALVAYAAVDAFIGDRAWDSNWEDGKSFDWKWRGDENDSISAVTYPGDIGLENAPSKPQMKVKQRTDCFHLSDISRDPFERGFSHIDNLEFDP
nr:hypothetical protein QSJ49_01300 [Halobacterium salinarum]